MVQLANRVLEATLCKVMLRQQQKGSHCNRAQVRLYETEVRDIYNA